MKKINFTKLLGGLLLATIMLLNQSCIKDTCKGTTTYVKYIPVYKSVDEIRQDINITGVRELCNPGKLFVYGDYIFVNELQTGIHVIDNKDPRNPQSITFIEIPGNVDIAVKDNILYADNYIDLVYFDITDPVSPIYKGRVEDVFSSISQNSVREHLLYYDTEEVTEEYECDLGYQQGYYFQEDFISINSNADRIFEGNFNSSLPNSTGAAPQGVGGSLSRFANFGEYLYVIDESALDIFDITNRCDPIYATEVEINRGIETLFSISSNLFIGADDGVYIYSLENPTQPNYLSKFEHARACDPVFVQDQTAYVTLRDGQSCEGFENQIDILNVSDLFNPTLITSVDLDNPHGLSLTEDILIVCEGEYGFKLFDKSNPSEILNNQHAHIDNIYAYDVIIMPGTKTALVIGKDGLYQYDFTAPNDPLQLSGMLVTRDCN